MPDEFVKKYEKKTNKILTPRQEIRSDQSIIHHRRGLAQNSNGQLAAIMQRYRGITEKYSFTSTRFNLGNNRKH